MVAFLNTFKASEDGAVTVDWVVLTASLVGLSVLAITTISGGSNQLGTSVSETVATTEIGVGN